MSAPGNIDEGSKGRTRKATLPLLKVRLRRFLDDPCWHFARLVCGSNDPLGSAEQLKTSPRVQSVCFVIGSDTARSARGAKEHASLR
jgi:hypothetical protein